VSRRAALPLKTDSYIEVIMSTTNVGIRNFRPHRASGWNLLRRRIGEWNHLARSRNELATLNDRVLHDMGIARCAADFEAPKPFWMA
jgi:uncharacterized protein YjiS (DUF1127 family)